MISVGIFEKTRGLIYSGNPNLLRIQLIGALSIAVWSVVMSFSFFFVLKKLGRLRVPIVCEIIGVDIIYYSDVKEIDGSKYLQ